MSRSVERTEHIDKKKVQELTLEYKLAEEAVLDGQVVSLGTTDGCVIPCTNQTIPYGVALNGVLAATVTAYKAETVGEDKIEVIVAMQGFTRVLGGEALDANMWVSVDANGRVVQGTPATEELIGFTVSACAGDGEQCSIYIHRIPAGDYAPAE